jgi:serine/threonine-protein kinase
MTISTGPSAVAVPNVVGTPRISAETAVAGAGLVVTITSVNDLTVPAGLVMAQAPIGGTNVPPGTAVALTVSIGRALRP